MSFAPTDRFARIVEALRGNVAASLSRGVAGALILLIWRRLHRIGDRFAVAARAGSGKVAASRRATGAARTPAAIRPQTDDARPRLPGGFGWLVRLAPATACQASQLQALLAEPDMAALIEAAPQIGRLLRPLCRMLAVDLPPGLRLPHRPRRRVAPAAPPVQPPRPPDGDPLHSPPCAFWLASPPRRAAARHGGPRWAAAGRLAPG